MDPVKSRSGSSGRRSAGPRRFSDLSITCPTGSRLRTFASPFPCLSSNRSSAVFARVRFASFLGGVVLAVAALYGALTLLDADDRLSPPPVSGTWCIDARFAWLKSDPQWSDANFIAVGSSTTWRNLDFSVAPPALKQGGIVNAAPCFLRMNQTRYVAGYLLDHAPAVKTLLTVVAQGTLRAVRGVQPSSSIFLFWMITSRTELLIGGSTSAIFGSAISRFTPSMRTSAEATAV